MSFRARTETSLIDLGTEDYRSVYRLQADLAAARRAGRISDVVIFVEHPSCITVGRTGGSDHILARDDELRVAGIDVHRSDRGGDVTYHGPGQLVCYAIVDLNARDRDVHAHLRRMEEVMIRTVAAFGVRAFREPGLPGAWCPQGKIGAVGVAARGWVTAHGAALNVDPCLEHYEMIVPCGLRGRGVTSLARITGSSVEMDQVRREMREAYRDVFETELVEDAKGVMACL